jgi:hypothetical protein
LILYIIYHIYILYIIYHILYIIYHIILYIIYYILFIIYNILYYIYIIWSSVFLPGLVFSLRVVYNSLFVTARLWGGLEQKAGQLIQKYGERYMSERGLRPDDPLRDNQARPDITGTSVVKYSVSAIVSWLFR